MYGVMVQAELDIMTLDGIMRAVFGARISGVSLDGGEGGTVWFYEEPSEADREQVAVALRGGEYGSIEPIWAGKVEAVWA